MKEIYKYTLQTCDQELTVKHKSRLLSLQVQNDEVVMWCLVDPNEKDDTIKIQVFGTGWVVENDTELGHIGTVQLNGLAWHYFYDKKGFFFSHEQ